MSGDEVGAAVAVLRAAVDGLLEVGLDGVDAAGFVGVLEAFEVQRRRLDAVDVRLLAAADEQHVAGQHCRASTADMLVHQLRLSPGEARARVRRARDLGPRHSLTGEPLQATHPVLAAAQRAGEISTQQIDVATRMLERIPPDISSEAMGPAEDYLLRAARHENPLALARSAALLLDRLDPDGREPDDERNHTRRRFGLTRRSNGSWTPWGSLTDETGLIWQTILDSLSAPAPATTSDRDDTGDGDGDGDGGVMPDPRTAPERTHDALRDLGIRLLRSGTLPDTGGTPVTILIRTDAEDLTDPDGLCQSEHGHVMRLRTLSFLTGDAELIPLLFDRTHSDCQLYLGRTQRLANRAQRRALAGRDGGCCFPSCDRPASWCEVHHIIEWAAGGRTDIDNLCLLCPFHHREFQRRGWAVVMSQGRPHWIPPRWIDPDQQPRTNTTHHLPEITFTADGAMTARLRR